MGKGGMGVEDPTLGTGAAEEKRKVGVGETCREAVSEKVRMRGGREEREKVGRTLLKGKVVNKHRWHS